MFVGTFCPPERFDFPPVFELATLAEHPLPFLARVNEDFWLISGFIIPSRLVPGFLSFCPFFQLKCVE